MLRNILKYLCTFMSCLRYTKTMLSYQCKISFLLSTYKDNVASEHSKIHISEHIIIKNLQHAFHFLESHFGHQFLNKVMICTHVCFGEKCHQVITLTLEKEKVEEHCFEAI